MTGYTAFTNSNLSRLRTDRAIPTLGQGYVYWPKPSIENSRRVKEAIHIRLHLVNDINGDSGIEIPKACFPSVFLSWPAMSHVIFWDLKCRRPLCMQEGKPWSCPWYSRLLFLCSSVPADGVVFAGLSDIPAALRFLDVAFFFTVLAGFRVAVLALAEFRW